MRYFNNGYDGFWGFHMIGGMIVGLIVLIAFIVLVVYVVNKLTNTYIQSRKNFDLKSEADDALRILNMRFANGEITEEEYERKKKLLISK